MLPNSTTLKTALELTKSARCNISVLVVNFSTNSLSQQAKLQIQRKLNISEVVEVHVPCHLKLGGPLMPQIDQMITTADKMIRAAGFDHGLAERKIVVPPRFADAAFIVGVWMAYAQVDLALPIRAIDIDAGWTVLDFNPKDVPFHDPVPDA